MAVSIAILAVLAGLVGNMWVHPEYIKVFGIYFEVVLLLGAIMFWRIRILKGIFYASRAVVQKTQVLNASIFKFVLRNMRKLIVKQLSFFY